MLTRNGLKSTKNHPVIFCVRVRRPTNLFRVVRHFQKWPTDRRVLIMVHKCCEKLLACEKLQSACESYQLKTILSKSIFVTVYSSIILIMWCKNSDSLVCLQLSLCNSLRMSSKINQEIFTSKISFFLPQYCLQCKYFLSFEAFTSNFLCTKLYWVNPA